MSKSEWQRMACSTERDKIAIKSWFSPVCDDMEPKSCEVLCDVETDATKKLRVVMLRKDGREVRATRTFGKHKTTIQIKPLRNVIQ